MKDLKISLTQSSEMEFKSFHKQISLKNWLGWAGGYGISTSAVNSTERNN